MFAAQFVIRTNFSLRVRGLVKNNLSFRFPSPAGHFYLLIYSSLSFLFARLFTRYLFPCAFLLFLFPFAVFLPFTRVFFGTRENSLSRICGTRGRMDPFFFPEIEDGDASEGCNPLLLLLPRARDSQTPRVAQAASERISLSLSARYRILNSPREREKKRKRGR